MDIYLIITLIYMWIFYLMFFYQWGFWIGYEVPWNQLTKTYLKVGDYKIWKQKWFYNICSKDKWCLDWKLKWISILSNDIYLYIEINIIESTLTYPDGTTKIWDYNYSLFVGDWVNNTITVKQKSDLPKFWYLSNNNLEFYSENELKNLPQELVNIFKELEENPIIKIDGKVY